jgi:acylphosphatase
MISAHIIVDGIVQGVGFRWFAQSLAIRYDLKGTVRNRLRGDVEIVLEGEKGAIEDFILDLRKGPRFGRVDAVDVEWREYSGKYRGFSIVH